MASSYMKGIKMEGKFSPGSFLLYMAPPRTNMKKGKFSFGSLSVLNNKKTFAGNKLFINCQTNSSPLPPHG
jgi:hypothetical protein